MRQQIIGAKNYVIKHWITTVIGIVLIIASVVLLVLDFIDGSELAIISAVGAGLVGVKDTNFVRRVFNVKQK